MSSQLVSLLFCSFFCCLLAIVGLRQLFGWREAYFEIVVPSFCSFLVCEEQKIFNQREEPILLIDKKIALFKKWISLGGRLMTGNCPPPDKNSSRPILNFHKNNTSHSRQTKSTLYKYNTVICQVIKPLDGKQQKI